MDLNLVPSACWKLTEWLGRPTQITCHGQTGMGRKKPVGPDWGNNGRSQSCQRVLTLGPCFLYYKSVR